MLREVEDEVAERAPAEGLRRAVDRVYMRVLGEAAGRMEGMTAPVLRALQVVVFGFGGGLVTQGSPECEALLPELPWVPAAASFSICGGS